MNILLPLALYALMSWAAGAIAMACIDIQAQRERAWVGVVLFGGPIAMYLLIYVIESIELDRFNKDVAYVKELCARDGGDRIYRSVEDVEGIFQVNYRAPTSEVEWRDQYGMQDPWGRAQGDAVAPALAIGPNVNNGYWFIEQRTGPNAGPPFLRKFSSSGDRKTDVLVQKLRSRYGYVTEDLTTKEMRKRWIAAGRIKVVDLRTNEILAERKGYFRALGPEVKLSWAGGGDAYQNQRICPSSELASFVKSVLHGVGHPPTEEQLDILKGK